MKVLVFGGTHGNEWTGVTVVTKYAERYKQKYPNLDLHFILANPEAYKINKRFKDEDLNRAFQFLHEDRRGSYEHARAKEIKKLIDEGPCFVIDLHTTTSNMGATVILAHYNPLNLNLASELSRTLPDCRIIGSPDPERMYLAGQSDLGLMIEVGPVANSLVEARSLESTLAVLDVLLDRLTKGASTAGGEVEIFEEIEDIYYPDDVYIHGDFQGKDFVPVKGKYTPYMSHTGKCIELEAHEELYPIFINEAAYYPTKLAFTLCKKRLMRF